MGPITTSPVYGIEAPSHEGRWRYRPIGSKRTDLVLPVWKDETGNLVCAPKYDGADRIPARVESWTDLEWAECVSSLDGHWILSAPPQQSYCWVRRRTVPRPFAVPAYIKGQFAFTYASPGGEAETIPLTELEFWSEVIQVPRP